MLHSNQETAGSMPFVCVAGSAEHRRGGTVYPVFLGGSIAWLSRASWPPLSFCCPCTHGIQLAGPWVARQGNYAAGNSFLDSFALHRQARGSESRVLTDMQYVQHRWLLSLGFFARTGSPALSVQWGPWADVGNMA